MAFYIWLQKYWRRINAYETDCKIEGKVAEDQINTGEFLAIDHLREVGMRIYGSYMDVKL